MYALIAFMFLSLLVQLPIFILFNILILFRGVDIVIIIILLLCNSTDILADRHFLEYLYKYKYKNRLFYSIRNRNFFNSLEKFIIVLFVAIFLNFG